MSYLVENPEDRFSHDMAQIIPTQKTLMVSVYITHKTDYQILFNVTWRKVECSHRNCFDLKMKFNLH